MSLSDGDGDGDGDRGKVTQARPGATAAAVGSPVAPVGSRAGLLALVVAAATWGATVVLIKIAARGIPVLGISVIEVVTATAVLGAVQIARRAVLPRPTRALIIAGLLEPGLAFPLINAGLSRTSGTHAALIIGLESVLVVLLAASLDRAWPSRRVVLALLLAVTGAALLSGSDGGSATLAGDNLVFAGVAAGAGYVIVAQRHAANFDALTLTFYQFLFGGTAVVAITAVAVWTGSSALWGQPSADQLGAAIATGVLGSAAAFVIYSWALTRSSAALAGTSLTLIPLFGIAFAAIFLGESVTGWTLAAAGAVIAGVALSSE